MITDQEIEHRFETYAEFNDEAMLDRYRHLCAMRCEKNKLDAKLDKLKFDRDVLNRLVKEGSDEARRRWARKLAKADDAFAYAVTARHLLGNEFIAILARLDKAWNETPPRRSGRGARGVVGLDLQGRAPGKERVVF